MSYLICILIVLQLLLLLHMHIALKNTPLAVLLLFLTIGIAPIYEFYYEGGLYRITENIFTNFGNPKLDDERELYVDTESLDQIYEPIRADVINKMTGILGGIFAAMSLFDLYMVYVVN